MSSGIMACFLVRSNISSCFFQYLSGIWVFGVVKGYQPYFVGFFPSGWLK